MKENTGKNSKKLRNNFSIDKLELLVTIVPRKKGDFYIDFIQSFECNMQFSCLGEGTASNELLNMLGLLSKEKTVIFSLVQSEKIPIILSSIENKFNTIKDGKGIAYTIPLSSIIGLQVFKFLYNKRSELLKGDSYAI